MIGVSLSTFVYKVLFLVLTSPSTVGQITINSFNFNCPVALSPFLNASRPFYNIFITSFNVIFLFTEVAIVLPSIKSSINFFKSLKFEIVTL